MQGHTCTHLVFKLDKQWVGSPHFVVLSARNPPVVQLGHVTSAREADEEEESYLSVDPEKVHRGRDVVLNAGV